MAQAHLRHPWLYGCALPRVVFSLCAGISLRSSPSAVSLRGPMGFIRRGNGLHLEFAMFERTVDFYETQLEYSKQLVLKSAGASENFKGLGV